MYNRKSNPTIGLKKLGIAAVIRLNLISSFLMIICASIILIYTPFFAWLIREIASSVGYGTAKNFYFIVENFELFSYSVGIFFILIAVLLLIAGYGYIKLKNWSKIIHTLVWSMTLVIIPGGTLLGLSALWLSSNVELDHNSKALNKTMKTIEN